MGNPGQEGLDEEVLTGKASSEMRRHRQLITAGAKRLQPNGSPSAVEQADTNRTQTIKVSQQP